MTPDEREVLKRIKATPTKELVEMYHNRPERDQTIEAAMDDRWLALAILGQLLARDEIHLLGDQFMSQSILSRGGLMMATLTDTPDGVKMELFHRARSCGMAPVAIWKLIDTAVYDQPFHVVRDVIHDAMQR